MLLVRCAYCHGAGKQKCACRCAGSAKKDSAFENSETEEVAGNLKVNLQPSDDEDLSAYSCSRCRDSGWVTCPSCCGSGFVEMPALA